jgi:osmotically inducible protein OsmC
MAIHRNVTAIWNGKGSDGKGILKSANNFFNDTPYTFKNRFENEDGKLGTNPEELLAAAHAGCYAMALSFAITDAGFTPEELKVNATVTLDKAEAGFEISGIILKLEGKVAGMSEDLFNQLANAAKDGCPISKALSAVSITLETTFVS